MSSGDLVARVRLRRSDELEIDVELIGPAERTVALLGPNGAGKTTILSAIAGLTPIDGGSIRLRERILDDPARQVFIPAAQRDIGVVFQDYLLFPHLSVEDNIAFGLRSRGVGSAAARERALEWMIRLGIDDHVGRRPPDLSGGQAQRVALARALVSEPELLLLDEPMSALDATSKVELRRLLLEHLSSFDRPRVLVTHDPAEAFLLADLIYIVEEGRVIQRGTPDEIRLQPKSAYAADLAGINLLAGRVIDGVVDVDGHPLHIADERVHGEVLLTIHPHSVSVHVEKPEGSPRNTWQTSVDQLEQIGVRYRLHTGDPLPLTVEVTAAARDELGLQAGRVVWLAVKATEIGVQEAARARQAESGFA